MSLACFIGGAPRAASSPSRSGQTQQRVPLLRLFSGHAFDPSCLLFDACLWNLFFLHVGRWHVKGGGYLSIATQGSYWLSSPHPLALSTASRPGKPVTAETRSRAGTRGRRAERGAKARGERHARTSPSNLTPVDARTRPHTRERPLILETSYRPEAPATVAPSLQLMLSHVSDVAPLSHRTTAAWAPKGTS
jgi:hypothetical protein